MFMKLDTSFPENYDLLKMYIHGNGSNPTALLNNIIFVKSIFNYKLPFLTNFKGCDPSLLLLFFSSSAFYGKRYVVGIYV